MASKRPAVAAKRTARTATKTQPATPVTSGRRSPRVSKTVALRAPQRRPPLGDAGASVKQGVARSLQGLLSIETEIAHLVAHSVGQALHAGQATAKDLVAVVRDVVAGAIQATEQTGNGLAVSVKGIARGVVMGVHGARADVNKAASEVVKLAVKHAGKVGADVHLIVRHAIDGIVEAATESGDNVARIAESAAAAALRAARKVVHVTTRTVTRSLNQIADGVARIGPAAQPVRTNRGANRPHRA